MRLIGFNRRCRSGHRRHDGIPRRLQILHIEFRLTLRLQQNECHFLRQLLAQVLIQHFYGQAIEEVLA
ncbi:hypothetical protein D3C73_1660530 [compost metagenome]